MIDSGEFFDLDDLRIALPAREVLSARIFSPQAYRRFQGEVLD